MMTVSSLKKDMVYGTAYQKDRKPLITSLTKELCIHMTRFYLKGEQEGWPEESNRVINDGVVDGKL